MNNSPFSEAKIPVDSASVSIINDYLPYGETPYVDHQLSPLPGEALHKWLDNKITATGRDGRVTIRIQEASLRWRKRPGKLRSMKYWPYRAIVRLQIEQFNRNGTKINSFPIQVMRVREIHEGFLRLPNHKDWWRMFTEIKKDVSVELRRKLSIHQPKPTLN